MDKKLAVDIVLLPSISAMKKIISFIEYLPASPIKLNTKDCLPHVSLAMGILKSSDLEKASQLLEELVASRAPVDLTIAEINDFTTGDNHLFSYGVVKTPDNLVQLHLDIMETFRGLLTHDLVDTSMFFSPPEVAQRSTYWVEHYYDKKGPEDFHPHITLGQGKVKKLSKPLTFSASRIALAHLGTYCSCRKILAEVRLGQNK